ncbi:hypothetical protein [Pseudonocardia nigra]|uniref:hypothetical protein n=1 Tax=Pseudonocardia nigra TaxID=1921578 RepID=UPI001C5D588B|nr:hypothetical protein [Pseudonocardia nigra]
MAGNLARSEHRRVGRFRRAVARVPNPVVVRDHADDVAAHLDSERRLRAVLDAIGEFPAAEREAIELCLLGEDSPGPINLSPEVSFTDLTPGAPFRYTHRHQAPGGVLTAGGIMDPDVVSMQLTAPGQPPRDADLRDGTFAVQIPEGADIHRSDLVTVQLRYTDGRVEHTTMGRSRAAPQR